jgi:hypothetical protein
VPLANKILEFPDLATPADMEAEEAARQQGDADTLAAARDYTDNRAVAHDISLEGSGTEFDPLSAGYYEPLTSTPAPDYDLRGTVSGHNPNSSWDGQAWSVTYASRSQEVVYDRQSLDDGEAITVTYGETVVTLFDGAEWVYGHKFFDPEYVFGLSEPFYFQSITGDPWEDASIIDYKVRKLEDAFYALVDSGVTASNPSTSNLVPTLTLFRKDGSSFDIDFTNIISNLVNKASANANGTTVFDNDSDDGLAISDTQPGTETIAAFETNNEAGNPVRIGHYLKHISNATDNYRLVGMIDGNSAKKLYLLKNKAAAPSASAQIDPDDEVLNKGEIAAVISAAISGIGTGSLPVPTSIELESELPDISGGAESTLYYLIENMDVSSTGAVRQGQAWAAQGATVWTKFIDLVNQLSLDAFKQRTDGSWVLADDIQTLIDNAVQGSQIQTTEPPEASADTQLTSAKRIWTMLGAALSSLTTTAKTIVGAINELVSGKQATLNRTVRTNLASTTAVTDSGGNITPGVTGTLPVANGGTGATTAAAALTNLGAVPVVKRYQHNISLSFTNGGYTYSMFFRFFSSSSAAITTASAILSQLLANGFDDPSKLLPASGIRYLTATPATPGIVLSLARSSNLNFDITLYITPENAVEMFSIQYNNMNSRIVTDVVVDLCA